MFQKVLPTRRPECEVREPSFGGKLRRNVRDPVKAGEEDREPGTLGLPFLAGGSSGELVFRARESQQMFARPKVRGILPTEKNSSK